MKKVLLLKEVSLNLENLEKIKENLLKIKIDGDKYITKKQAEKVIVDVEESINVLLFSKDIENIESYEKDIHEYTKYTNKLKRFLRNFNND